MHYFKSYPSINQRVDKDTQNKHPDYTHNKIKKRPEYKLAKLIAKKLEMHIPMSYNFNIKNSVHLMNDFFEISCD
jgi:hypothetical protein